MSSEFILTGDAARQAAMEHAELMAIVSTDRLNARTEPSTMPRSGPRSPTMRDTMWPSS